MKTLIPTQKTYYMTPFGYQRLTEELELLLKKERPRIVEIVSWAASNGDRSENGDYLYGKKNLREIDHRIRFLAKRLECANIVDPIQQKNRDQIFFGATVVLCDEQDTERTYSIVGIDEAILNPGWISWISPMAKALFRLRVGDIARCFSPSGERELEIIEVRYEALRV